MLIKVQKYHNPFSFLLIDNAESVTYTEIAQEISSDDSYRKFLIDNEMYFCGEPLASLENEAGIGFSHPNDAENGAGQVGAHPVEARWIKYIKDNKKHAILFSGKAYICNDSGDTLQKLG